MEEDKREDAMQEKENGDNFKDQILRLAEKTNRASLIVGLLRTSTIAEDEDVEKVLAVIEDSYEEIYGDLWDMIPKEEASTGDDEPEPAEA